MSVVIPPLEIPTPSITVDVEKDTPSRGPIEQKMTPSPKIPEQSDCGPLPLPRTERKSSLTLSIPDLVLDHDSDSSLPKIPDDDTVPKIPEIDEDEKEKAERENAMADLLTQIKNKKKEIAEKNKLREEKKDLRKGIFNLEYAIKSVKESKNGGVRKSMLRKGMADMGHLPVEEKAGDGIFDVLSLRSALIEEQESSESEEEWN